MNNGKEMNLREFIECRHKEYIGLPAYRWDEGLVWAMQDYFGSMGEFSEKDIKFIEQYQRNGIAGNRCYV